MAMVASDMMPVFDRIIQRKNQEIIDAAQELGRRINEIEKERQTEIAREAEMQFKGKVVACSAYEIQKGEKILGVNPIILSFDLISPYFGPAKDGLFVVETEGKRYIIRYIIVTISEYKRRAG